MGNTNGSNSMVNAIESFKGIVDNPLSKYLLRYLTGYCEKDHENRLEVALELYLGIRKDACFSCRSASKVVSYIVKKGAKSFGVSEDQLKSTMKDSYWRRGLISVLKGIAFFGVRKPFVPGAPFQVVWNITKACNMNCLHCYESAGIKGNDELTSEQIHQGIDILADAGVTILAFSGGEPTIHPNIVEFISHAHNRGMYVAIATNGYVLANKYVIRKLKSAGLGYVQISLDGLNPNTHDSFRRVKGAWEHAVRAIKNSVEEGLFVEVATTVTKYNINEIPEMIKFVRNLKANWFMLYNFVPTGRGKEIIESDLSPRERFDLLKLAYSETGDGGLQVLSTAPQYAAVAQMFNKNGKNIIPTHFYNPEYNDPKIRQLAEFIGGCGAGRFYISIEPNGDIYPCVFFPHVDEVKIGNLLKDDFEKLWREHELLWKLRNKDILEGFCGKCAFRYTCGGCRARAYNYFGNVLAPDPGCIFNSKEWNKLRSELLIKYHAEETPAGNILIRINDTP
ncbi:MAG: radical SAM protein [Thermoprotei archaeon]